MSTLNLTKLQAKGDFFFKFYIVLTKNSTLPGKENVEVLHNPATMPTVTSQKKNQPHNQKYVTLLQEKLHGGRYNGLGCWFSIPDLRFVMLKKKQKTQ